MYNKVNQPIDQIIIDEFRNYFETEISNRFSEDNVCILLSGGIDSTLLGLVCHHLGKKVTTVSYQLDNQTNIDCDRSEMISKTMGWEFHKVIVPTKDYKDWFFHLILNQNCKKKTELEILYPTIFMMNKIKDLGFKKVIGGFGNPLVDGREKMIEGRKDWIGLLNRFDNWSITDGTQKCIDFGKSIGVEIELPFTYSEIPNLLKKVTFKQIHFPHQKILWKRIYEDEINNLGMMKVKNIPLQKGNGLPQLFPKVLNDPNINIPIYEKGNDVVRLGSLIKWWSKQSQSKVPNFINLNPSSKEGTLTNVRTYQPYKLEDMTRESEKELFSVVTTFSGGGGSSVGYKLGGGKILLMNEFIKDGVDTYLLNHPNTPFEMCDIRKITRKGGRKYVVDFFKSKGIEVGCYDILDGSPPCSTFSSSGKGKIKIEEKDVKYSETTQSRIGMLINDFVYFVNCTKPKICIVENVERIKNSDVFQYNLKRLRRRGYRVNFKMMNSSHFGVPQNRRRLICVGIREDVSEKIGLQNEDEILDLFPTESSYQPTIKDGFEGLEVDEVERRQLLINTKRSSSYELISNLPKNPNRIFKVCHIDPNWTSDFNMVRSSWDKPSPTLTQMGQQMGRGGIFHPSEDRVFTTNEMKRLMGLPIDYKFSGNFNQRIERMGRMVSPLIYKYLSKSLYENILKPTQNLRYVETV